MCNQKQKLKILLINKFLYPNGGSETYCFNLARYLEAQGHEVQFFGMEHPRNVVGNALNLGVSNVEFKKVSLEKMTYPLKIIYSREAKRKLEKVIEAQKPDILHLNNFNFQLTPSILYAAKKYNIPVVMTLHDFQLVCPNHMLYLEHETRVCEECKGGKYGRCIKNRCIHNSKVKSVLAALESWMYHKLRTYNKYIDCYISPSAFLKEIFAEFGEDGKRIQVLHNFITGDTVGGTQKQNYVLYFGRLSVQKGIDTLIEACRKLPHIPFVFAGSGELEVVLQGIENIRFVGFKSGDELKTLIREARFSVYPSEWYENCPMSVLESKMYGTPVIGADIGGIPELIADGEDGHLFQPGNVSDLVEKIRWLYENPSVTEAYARNGMANAKKFSIDTYYEKLMAIYQSAMAKHINGKEYSVWQSEPYTDQS